MENEVVSIKMDDIIPNRFQPREVFDEKALNELADSIRQHGVLEPILVRPVSNKYEIIAGERRYKASALAGLTKIPALVREMDDKESAIVAFIENSQRQDVSAIEEAKTIDRIIKANNMTQDELAKSLGISQSNLANKLRLLSLPVEIQDALMKKEISERHARSLLSVKDVDKQLELLNKIKEKRMTVRELDGEIKNMYNNNLNNTFIPNFNNGMEQNNNFIGNMNNPQNTFMANNGMQNMPNNNVGNDSFTNFLNEYDNNNPVPATGPATGGMEPVQNTNMGMPTNDSFTNFLNEYDNNNPVPAIGPATGGMEPVQNTNMGMPTNDSFTNFLNEYDNNNPVPDMSMQPQINTNNENQNSFLNNYAESAPINNDMANNDSNFMSFLNQYDNNNPLPTSDNMPQQTQEIEQITDVDTNNNAFINNYTNESMNNNVLINDVNPPITSNFNANGYIEDNPNFVDVSTKPLMNSVDEVISELKRTVDKIKSESKYKIDTDEINFDDLYQITIKIDKRDF